MEALEKLFNASIPTAWLKWSWQSATIGTWFQGMLAALRPARKVVEQGRPKAYWLTGFFNPQVSLTAMKQEVNRKHAKERWALDDVVMDSWVTSPPLEVNQLKEEAKDGVYVYGLFLEGCKWSGEGEPPGRLDPKKLFVPLPVLQVTGRQAKDVVKKNQYDCPAYRVKKRTGLNFISTFPLRTEDPPSKWIMRGAALLCSVD